MMSLSFSCPSQSKKSRRNIIAVDLSRILVPFSPRRHVKIMIRYGSVARRLRYFGKSGGEQWLLVWVFSPEGIAFSEIVAKIVNYMSKSARVFKIYIRRLEMNKLAKVFGYMSQHL